eukprot:TRINITY_DN8617_c2_g1_i1.p1 TRINITY_DN8617_c2_g1~~TRINITY_DN8617_c2_g1_i1.p1  ORF type:complete len:506 (+),score=38.85 TRINITY_DN8617_c2_g1_i1:73-1518(+)
MKWVWVMVVACIVLCGWQVGVLSRMSGEVVRPGRGFGRHTSTKTRKEGDALAVIPGNAKNFDPPETIFVSIAAFRDVETNSTLHSMFARAKLPQRIHVGLICQVDLSRPNETCLFPGAWDSDCGTQEWCPSDNIRGRTFSAEHAKGPTFARHLASLLYRGEDYFMMIDSHNRFVKNWDEVIIGEYKKTGETKSVLSTYPMGINPKDEEVEDSAIAYLCALGKTHGWTAGFPGPYWANSFRPAKYPKPQPYIGAGLVFGPGQMVIDVPFDPYLPYLFFGEEFLIGIRLWTNGYNLYSPGVNIIYHRYNRKGPRMETHGSKVSIFQAKSHKRIQHIIGVTKPGVAGQRLVPLDTTEEGLTAGLPKYGLGTVRSLWQYWKFSHLDPVVQNMQTFKDHWCVSYGPHTGPYDDKWRKYAAINDIEPSKWWSNGVAILAVPPQNTSSTRASSCQDDYPECVSWASSGECEKNPHAKEFCRLSCGGCK